VDEGEVSLIISVHEIMIVGVDLNRSKLSLVHNVLVGQGADVEPVLEANGVCGTLSQHVQLALEETLIKGLRVGVLRGGTSAVGGGEDDERLHNDGLAGLGRRTQQSRVNGGPSPAKHPQAQRLSNIFQLPLGFLQCLFVGLEKQVTSGVLTQRGQLDVLLLLEVLDEEPVRNRSHDTGTVTISRIGTHRTTVGHVAEQVACCEMNGQIRCQLCTRWTSTYHR
jgi:hypothetical protein